jgi:urocanate hydratase
MKRAYAAALGLAVTLMAGVALADQVEGTVEKVDANTNTVWINGQPYKFEGAVKLKVSEIQVGQKLRLQYDVNTNNVYEAEPAK